MMTMSDASQPMAGKVCLITGATSGIGEVTARALAQQGATVCLVGRNAERCQATAGRIRSAAPGALVDFLVADLSSQEDVRRLAREVRERYPRLDVLVNNAGALFMSRGESVDGIERTLALNHLGYFLLTDLLLESLKAAAPARVVNVSSDAHRMVAGLDFDDLEGRRKYAGMRVYSRSKLANILFTRELARRLEGTGVTANALHPGVVATNFGADNGALAKTLRRVCDWFSISAEQGAKTSIHLASSPTVEGVSGRYFVKCREARPNAAARDDAAARRLWDISEALTARTAGAKA